MMIAVAQQSNILEFPSVAPQGKSNEWYTPARYIEAAREVMGSIDLDPASCEMANRTVKARRYYTKEDDGLSKEWHGRVWLNPPYGRTRGYTQSNIGLFTQKIIRDYKQGCVSQAVLLSTTKTSTSWFDWLWEYPICFTNHLIPFNTLTPTTNWNGKAYHIHGTIFVYLGPNEQKFTEVFSQFGTIAKRVSQPRHTIATPSLWEVAE